MFYEISDIGRERARLHMAELEAQRKLVEIEMEALRRRLEARRQQQQR